MYCVPPLSFYNRRASAWRINWTAGRCALTLERTVSTTASAIAAQLMRGTRALRLRASPGVPAYLRPVLEKNVEASADQNRERPVGGTHPSLREPLPLGDSPTSFQHSVWPGNSLAGRASRGPAPQTNRGMFTERSALPLKCLSASPVLALSSHASSGTSRRRPTSKAVDVDDYGQADDPRLELLQGTLDTPILRTLQGAARTWHWPGDSRAVRRLAACRNRLRSTPRSRLVKGWLNGSGT